VKTTTTPHVARHGNKVALPGYVFDLKTKRRRKLAGDPLVRTYAFDGEIAVGRFRYVGFRDKDAGKILAKRTYILARDGIGYWIERSRNNALDYTIKAAEIRKPGMRVIEVGKFKSATTDPGPEFILGRSIALSDKARSPVPAKWKRFSFYWNEHSLVWNSAHTWHSRCLLAPKDFE
jgi:hypothetical protein